MIIISYIILPFVIATQSGKLVPGTPRRAINETKAVAFAECMATRHPGLMVLETWSDPARDLFAEPRLVRAIGQMSATVFEALAA